VDRLRWLWSVVCCAVRVDLSFRGSWLLNVVSRLSQFAISVLFFGLIYGERTEIGGVSWHDMMVVLGAFQSVIALSDMLTGGVRDISSKVEDGSLDYDLLKPIGARLVVSVGRVQITRLFEVFTGIVVAATGARSLSSPVDWAAFGLLVCVGAWIKYCLSFMLHCSAFWFIETYGLYGLFDQVFDLARYPMAVFRGLTRILFVYVLPVAIVANTPAVALLGRPFGDLLVLALAHATAWYALGSFLWTKAICRYTGASA